MQFFPDSIGVSALGGVGIHSGSVDKIIAGANDFLDSFNAELAASGINPIVDAAGETSLPRGFRTIQRDVNAALSNEDITSIIDKLRKRGVKEDALSGIEGLLADGSTPTIGSIMGHIRGKGRATPDLSDEELQTLDSALQKVQLSPEETEEFMQCMQEGRGMDAMRLLKGKLADLGEGSLALTSDEARSLARALDLSENGLQKVAGLFTKSEDGKSLEELLGPITERLATRQAEMEKLAAEFKSTVDAALREKKFRERNEPVADMRGSQLADRAERRMRDDLTAKGIGLGKPAEETREEEAALADEQAAYEQEQHARQERSRDHKTVLAQDLSHGKSSTQPEQAASQAKQDFNPVLHRMDAASGMTMPAHNQAAAPTLPNTATAFTHRQEIYSQVEQGMLRQLADGTRQMTLQLNPAELGQLTLILSVKGGEVRALIRADNPEATAALSDQMNQLRTTLEEQGLKVAQLDVETQLPRDTTREQWDGSDFSQFNKEQELRERERFQRLAKIRRKAGTTLAQDMQSKGMREEIAASGLHIIA